MARQLLQDRTPTAYAGVEAYARRHDKEDAGALAWLVLGYAHALDHDYAKAIDPLNRAKARRRRSRRLCPFYLGTSYFQAGQTAEAAETLADFDTTYPESLLIRDAHILYGNALLAQGRPLEAIALLEKDRQPPACRSGTCSGTRLCGGRTDTKGRRCFAQSLCHDAAERRSRRRRTRN